MGYKRSMREGIEDEKHAAKISTKLGIKGMLNIGFFIFMILIIATILTGVK